MEPLRRLKRSNKGDGSKLNATSHSRQESHLRLKEDAANRIVPAIAALSRLGVRNGELDDGVNWAEVASRFDSEPYLTLNLVQREIAAAVARLSRQQLDLLNAHAQASANVHSLENPLEGDPVFEMSSQDLWDPLAEAAKEAVLTDNVESLSNRLAELGIPKQQIDLIASLTELSDVRSFSHYLNETYQAGLTVESEDPAADGSNPGSPVATDLASIELQWNDLDANNFRHLVGQLEPFLNEVQGLIDSGAWETDPLVQARITSDLRFVHSELYEVIEGETPSVAALYPIVHRMFARIVRRPTGHPEIENPEHLLDFLEVAEASPVPDIELPKSVAESIASTASTTDAVERRLLGELLAELNWMKLGARSTLAREGGKTLSDTAIFATLLATAGATGPSWVAAAAILAIYKAVWRATD